MLACYPGDVELCPSRRSFDYAEDLAVAPLTNELESEKKFKMKKKIFKKNPIITCPIHHFLQNPGGSAPYWEKFKMTLFSLISLLMIKSTNYNLSWTFSRIFSEYFSTCYAHRTRISQHSMNVSILGVLNSGSV